MKGWLLYLTVAGTMGVLGWGAFLTGPLLSPVFLLLIVAAYVYALRRIYVEVRMMTYDMVSVDPRLTWIPAYFKASRERLIELFSLNSTCAACITLMLTVVDLYVA